MKAELAVVGARGVDSLPFSQGGDRARAQCLVNSGIDFFVGYLGAVNPDRLAALLDVGLAFMPCTFAAAFDGTLSVRQCQALSLPKGTTVWLDLEGFLVFRMDPAQLIAKINAWATEILAAGYEPGLYIGSPQPLTGDELYRLKVVRYWKAPSRIGDRNGQYWDGPQCGFCMYQLWPSQRWRDSGVFVDVDFIQQDFKGRLPTWVCGD